MLTFVRNCNNVNTFGDILDLSTDFIMNSMNCASINMGKTLKTLIWDESIDNLLQSHKNLI